MISKYTKAVLTVIALSVLALPVKAEENNSVSGFDIYQ